MTFYLNWKVFVKKDAIENVVCKMAYYNLQPKFWDAFYWKKILLFWSFSLNWTQGSSWQKVNIGSGDGLAPYKPTLVLANISDAWWCHRAALI